MDVSIDADASLPGAVLAEAKASGALKLVVGCFQLSSGVVSLIE